MRTGFGEAQPRVLYHVLGECPVAHDRCGIVDQFRAVTQIKVQFSAVLLRSHIRSDLRSEEHTSELQSLMRISYAVFCLKKKKPTAPLAPCCSYEYINRETASTPEQSVHRHLRHL